MDKEYYEREITVRLFQASNALQVMLDRMLKTQKLTAKQFFIMIIIGNYEHDPNISEIAETFKTSHQNVKKILVKLERQGFIELYKDKSDSRITRARFTALADEFWKKRETKDVMTMNRLYENISIEDMKIVRNVLMQLSQTMEGLETK